MADLDVVQVIPDQELHVADRVRPVADFGDDRAHQAVRRLRGRLPRLRSPAPRRRARRAPPRPRRSGRSRCRGRRHRPPRWPDDRDRRARRPIRPRRPACVRPDRAPSARAGDAGPVAGSGQSGRIGHQIPLARHQQRRLAELFAEQIRDVAGPRQRLARPEPDQEPRVHHRRERHPIDRAGGGPEQRPHHGGDQIGAGTHRLGEHMLRAVARASASRSTS